MERDEGQHGSKAKPHLFTVGHSNHAIERFLELLIENGVEVLIDVRTNPSSRYSPQFNARDLADSLQDANIRYGFYGKELGGRPTGTHFYDTDGRVFYGEVARTPLFRDGLERLKRGLQTRRVAIMCSEEDPFVCHRRLLVGRVLFGEGVALSHIRGSGNIEIETGADWIAEEEAARMDLFASEESARERERRTWKSIPSVLPKRAQNGFSDD